MKAIIVAGGTGTRLYPLTAAINKHLLPVYDKPLIYYPLATAMLAGARDVSIVIRPQDRQAFEQLLGDGRSLGMNIGFVIQDQARGIADALLRCEDSLSGEEILLLLGDNLLHGPLLGESLRGRVSTVDATVFSYEVNDPRAYACVEVDALGHPISLIEKPAAPRSNLAVPGIYFLPPDSIEVARGLRPSARGELEITDLNGVYLKQGRLRVIPLPRGTAWMDAGSPDSLIEAGNYVRILQQRQGLPIACPEEIALRNGWISEQDIGQRIAELQNTAYSRLLIKVAGRTPT